MYRSRSAVKFLLVNILCVVINMNLSQADVGRRIGSFVDVEDGKTYHSKLYELLSDEPEEENVEHPVEESVDGDMLLTREQIQTVYETRFDMKRKISSKSMMWPNGIIPWKFDSKNRKFQRHESRTVVLKAIKHWEEHTCLKFVYFESEEFKKSGLRPDAILIFGNGSGCASPVGFSPGVLNVYLNEVACIHVGTIVHEIGHVVGFFHEHARSDRNSHVSIIQENVREEIGYNFLVTSGLTNIADYDLGSIMHYGPKYFSKNGRNTIIPKIPLLEFLMGQRDKLSFYDIQEVNLVYKCAARCKDSTPCENGGFLIKSCQCFCPDGLSGPECQNIDPRRSQEAGGIFALTFEGSKVISSDGLRRHTSSIWVIKAPENTTMTISLTLDLAHDPYAHVCYHWLEIRFNLIGQPGPRFCGSCSTPIQLKSSGNSILVRYNSEDSRYGVRKGFILHVSVEHPIASTPTFSIKLHGIRPTTDATLLSSSVGAYTYRAVVCNFKQTDMDTCPFYRVKGTNADWTSYEQTASRTNSNVDETSYLYVSSVSGRKGAKAILESAEVREGTWCLRFLSVIVGAQTYGHLVVVAITTKDTSTWRLWDSFSHTGYDLIWRNISLKSHARFKIRFEAEVEDDLTIALGRIRLDPGHCDHPDRAVDLVHKNDPNAVFSCNFDCWCGFSYKGGGKLNWSRRHSFPVLGPTSDHTQRRKGYFITRSSLNQVGRTRSLVTSLLRISPDGCVRFWLYVWGYFPGTLSLSLQDGSQKQTTLWSETFRGLQALHWCQVSVPVHTSKPSRVTDITLMF